MLLVLHMSETERTSIISGLYPKVEPTPEAISERFQRAVIDLLLAMRTAQ